MSLLKRLRHADDKVRLDAAIAAGRSGDLALVDTLLDLALHDDTEVRTIGGMAEVYEHVGDSAADALRTLLAKVPGVDPRIRAAVLDLGVDDDRAATLLYYLGGRYEPLRAELEEHPEGRVRLRAVRALLASGDRRDRAFSERWLADGEPLLRVEALRVPLAELDLDAVTRALLEDPDARVREQAAIAMRYRKAVDSAPFVVAARRETEPAVRAVILSALLRRARTEAVVHAVLAFVADPTGYVRRSALTGLGKVGSAPVVTAIASRVPVEPQDGVWWSLLEHRNLLAHVPELRDLLTL